MVRNKMKKVNQNINKKRKPKYLLLRCMSVMAIVLTIALVCPFLPLLLSHFFVLSFFLLHLSTATTKQMTDCWWLTTKQPSESNRLKNVRIFYWQFECCFKEHRSNVFVDQLHTWHISSRFRTLEGTTLRASVLYRGAYDITDYGIRYLTILWAVKRWFK